MITELSEAKKPVVLVCDDDPVHLVLMHETLVESNFVVFEAINGRSAIEQYQRVQPELILLDVNMPERDGFDVCRWIRQQLDGRDVPILMITGADDYRSIETAFRCGATDFMPKPIKWPMISHRLRYMLKNSNAILELQQVQKRLERIAYYDVLTDLPNLQLLKKQGQKMLVDAAQNKTKLVLLYIDLDRFKRINETLGYDNGDKLLTHIANQLRNNLQNIQSAGVSKKADLNLARLGGDEFIVLLTQDITEAAIQNICETLIESIQKPLKLGSYEVVVTPSIGITSFPDDGKSITELLKCADMALNSAKQKGKGKFHFYSQTTVQKVQDRLRIEEAMRASLLAEDFYLAYQPQVSMQDNLVYSVEALLRWDHSELGSISPVDFIPLAEDTGMIIELGAWVLKEACRQANIWREMWPKHPIRIAVNISGRQLNDPGFDALVENVLNETQLPANLLELEFTESIVMDNAATNIERLKKLKRLGIQLSIDDFGTGYSSLSYLKRFPIDALKIDRSFIKDLAVQETDKEIVKVILSLAESLKLYVVVEGIETKEQVACINSLCAEKKPHVQGFYFYRPEAATECTKRLHKLYCATYL